MTDLVVASLEAWDGVWRRNQYLIAGLLRSDPGLRVLFVEPAADPLHAARRARRPTWGRGLREVEGVDGVGAERLWAYQPTKILPRRLDPTSGRRGAHAVQRAALRVGFRDPLLWVNDPHAAALLQLSGWRSLYDVTDDWLEADRAPGEHRRLVRDESILMRRCAEVVVCSPGLAESKGRQRAVTLVPNAVDVAAYRVPTERPSDLPPGPVALYLGTVHTDRIDLTLCVETAGALAGVGHVVLVGPAPLDAGDVGRLRAAGVVLLGAKDRAAVPAYLQHADVLLVPHVVTPFTDSLDPIKLYEYRAVARPVVSTPVAGFRESSDSRITLASGSDFVDAVRTAVSAPPEPSEERGRPSSRSAVPTWEDRVNLMRAILDRVTDAGPDAGRPRSPRRVLYCHSSAPGGAELAAPALAAQIGAALWIRGDGEIAAGARALGVPVLVLPARSDRRPRSVGGALLALADLVRVQAEVTRILRRARADVVLSNTVQGLTHLALAARLTRTPLVAYVRDLGDGGNRSAGEVRLYRELLARTHGVVFNSELTRASWGRADGLVVPTAVPEEFYDTWRGGDGTRAVMLGRLARWKGQREVIQAVGELAARREVELTIVGGAQFGDDADLGRAGALDLEPGVVQLVPHVARPWEHLRDADVLVHASLTPEPFGQVLAQAAAAGVPIVCADRGGHLEWLEHGVTCLTANPRSPGALADAIEHVFSDPDAARRRAKAARAGAERFRAEQAYAPIRPLLEGVEAAR